MTLLMGELLRMEADFMLVYVISKRARPLVPCNPQKARKLLKEQKVEIEVVERTPFTIQQLYGYSGYVHVYKLFDKVEYLSGECFVFGRRKSGYFYLRTLDGEVVSRSASVGKQNLLKDHHHYYVKGGRRHSSPR